ncbi:MAG: GRP family sugar transporter [Nitrosotalea sp.]
MISLGLLSAVGAAICWGGFFVPVKKVKVVDIWQLQGATGIGVILFAIPIGFLWGFQILPAGLLSGAIWAAGNILALYSVKLIGLSRTSPFLAGFSILVSFLWGVLYFDEKFNYMALAIIAIGLLFGGLVFISNTSKNLPIRKKGYLIAITSGLVGGSYVIPLQATHSLQAGFFSSSLSIFAIGVPLLLLSRKFAKKEMIAGVLSGGLFNMGSLSVLIAVGLIGITVAYPISQTATLFAISWGVLYFREIVHRRDIFRIITGAGLILCGAALITIA